MRPKRLFGFDGTADEDPRPSTGLMSLRGLGPSSATATALLSPAVLIKLQGALAGFVGMTGTPFNSGGSRRERGISKNGNPRVRGIMTPLIRRWIRRQLESALSRRFRGAPAPPSAA
jgi:transposase